MPRPARLPSSILPCLALLVLLTGLTGCHARQSRPDARVAKIVEREDRRLVELSAMAAVDVEPVELASASPTVALEALGLLYVPDRRQAPPPPEPTQAPRPAGWLHGAPTWVIHAWAPPASPDWTGLFEPGEQALSDDDAGGSDEGSRGDDDGREGRGGRGRPRLRVNFLKFRINDRPVSFSGSAKGTNAVQFRATIRM